jgi:hypothetical protein
MFVKSHVFQSIYHKVGITFHPDFMRPCLIIWRLLSYQRLLNAQTYLTVPLSILIHESFHALGYFTCIRTPKKISFGLYKSCIPYTRIPERLSKKQFIITALFPFLCIAMVSFTLSLFIRNNDLVSFAIVNIFGCSGDFLLVLKKARA